MKRQTWTMLCVLTALAGTNAFAAPSVSLKEIQSEIARIGAQATIADLSKGKHQRFDMVVDQIWTDDPEWVALAAKLAPGTDGGNAEALGIALAGALPKNAGAVLRAMDLCDRRVLGPSRVCSSPFLAGTPEGSIAYIRRYQRRAIVAVTSVHDQTLDQVKQACLTVLRRRVPPPN